MESLYVIFNANDLIGPGGQHQPVRNLSDPQRLYPQITLCSSLSCFQVNHNFLLVNLEVQGMHPSQSPFFFLFMQFSAKIMPRNGDLYHSFYAYPTDLSWYLLGCSCSFNLAKLSKSKIQIVYELNTV